jgi:hypothetical protein
MYNTKEYICFKMNWSISNYHIGYLYKAHDKEVEQFYEGLNKENSHVLFQKLKKV